MKKFIALMCVGALALTCVNGFNAEAKKKKTNRRVAKTEKVAPVANAEAQPECQATLGCEKMKGDCKNLKKDETKGLKKVGMLKKNDCKEVKGECKDMKGECKDMKGECGKEMKGECGKGECGKGECKEGEHKCAHQSPCCKEGKCKKDGECGKEKCKDPNGKCCE
ncbi:MAG: hypothetical protein J6X22_04800 [Muribaculaceae bacterium]|nr:hypothetical protein [Muribaculaceae bacterium]